MSDYLAYAIKRDDLERKLGGGLSKGSLTIVEGKEGSGKSILSQRVAFGMLENNQSVTFISSELSTRDFLKQMKSLEYNIVKYLLNKQLLFLPVFPTTARLEKKHDLLERLISAPELFEKDVIIVDSLNALIDASTLDENLLFQFVTFLKRIIGIEKSVIINFDPAGLNDKLKNLLEEIADNFLFLESKLVQNDMKNVVIVKRWARSEKEVSKVIAYRVEPRIGVIIDISSFSG